MKKYISILSLITAVALQSCDRADPLSNTDEQFPVRGQRSQEKLSALSGNANAENTQINKLETGDDDEPRKDKSHWRTSNDTIRL